MNQILGSFLSATFLQHNLYRVESAQGIRDRLGNLLVPWLALAHPLKGALSVYVIVDVVDRSDRRSYDLLRDDPKYGVPLVLRIRT